MGRRVSLRKRTHTFFAGGAAGGGIDFPPCVLCSLSDDACSLPRDVSSTCRCRYPQHALSIAHRLPSPLGPVVSNDTHANRADHGAHLRSPGIRPRLRSACPSLSVWRRVHSARIRTARGKSYRASRLGKFVYAGVSDEERGVRGEEDVGDGPRAGLSSRSPSAWAVGIQLLQLTPP
ncbi:hypothetical protein FA95DRAFT_1126002 [Auriscalpium vulgare]|uniref:Uncharacterized protein n=1 Tax=Auriscalpium vulgare TaxID=40419 RepID=A0ACB8RWC2_9AGAM|nr:hypothetical protein FA95DRAFT_1126002 [Auriscalpium vulgare]